MMRYFVLVAMLFSFSKVYAQRMDQDFTPFYPFDKETNTTQPSVSNYPDKPFTIYWGCEETGHNGASGKTVNVLKYAKDGVLYSLTMPNEIFTKSEPNRTITYTSYEGETYVKSDPNRGYSKEEFLDLPEVKFFVSHYYLYGNLLKSNMYKIVGQF